jgi:Sperm-tail PG-rich repeat
MSKLIYNVFILVSIPAPGTYDIKTCFGEESPTIKQNHLTTDFRLHSARKDYDKVYVPGARSPRQMDFVPGPGTYSFLNQSIG